MLLHALAARCLYHVVAVNFGANLLQLKGGGEASLCWVTTPSELIQDLRVRSSLGSESIALFVETLTRVMSYQGIQRDDISGMTIDVLGPSGSSIVGTPLMYPPSEFYPPVSPPIFSATCTSSGTRHCAGNAVMNIGPISAAGAGTYAVVLTPAAGSGAGNVNFSLMTPASGGSSLQPDCTPKTIGLSGGGSALIPVRVSVMWNTHYTLLISEVNQGIPVLEATVVDANGVTVPGLGGFSGTCASPCTGNYFSSPLASSKWSGSLSGGFTTGSTSNYRILLRQTTRTASPNDYGWLTGNVTLTLTNY